MKLNPEKRNTQAEKIMDKARVDITKLADKYIRDFAKKWPLFASYRDGMGLFDFVLKDDVFEKYSGLSVNQERWHLFNYERLIPDYIFPEDYTYPDLDLNELYEDSKALYTFIDDNYYYIDIDKIKF